MQKSSSPTNDIHEEIIDQGTISMLQLLPLKYYTPSNFCRWAISWYPAKTLLFLLKFWPKRYFYIKIVVCLGFAELNY